MSTDAVIARLAQWAEANQAVRAMILTSTRAIPDGYVDAYSDYDVVLVVDAVGPLVKDTSWLSDFGDVLVAYWDPVHVDFLERGRWRPRLHAPRSTVGLLASTSFEHCQDSVQRYLVRDAWKQPDEETTRWRRQVVAAAWCR